MGLFALNYRPAEGRVYAEGGLKFRADEVALRRYFAPILSRVSLNDLIGEAVFWVHFGDTAAVWVFPVVLYARGIGTAVVVAAVVYLAAELLSRALYLKALNYVVFALGNRVLQILVYGALAVLFWINGSRGNALSLVCWLLCFQFGIAQLALSMLLLPIDLRLFSLPPSDQALRNVGLYYGVRFGLDPMTWRMYGPDESGCC